VALTWSLAVLGLTLLLTFVVAEPRTNCGCPDGSDGIPIPCPPCSVDHAGQILFLTLGAIGALVIALGGVLPPRPRSGPSGAGLTTTDREPGCWPGEPGGTVHRRRQRHRPEKEVDDHVAACACVILARLGTGPLVIA
jgi:hypothetical protein